VVEPYLWLLDRVGDGLKLTQAGYLPPAVVTETMTALGWADGWIGKQNREDVTHPVLELRESAQRFGLLRKYRGQLLPTKVGRQLKEDPARLWWQLATHLPDARSEPEQHAGLLYLLTVAAGAPRNDNLLAEGMTILGWRGPGHSRLSGTDAFGAARDTWALFRRLGLLADRRWTEPEPEPSPEARSLAQAALFGTSGERTEAIPPPAAQLVQLLVTLRDIEPAIWRRLLVPDSLTLRELHAVLQTAFGWQDYHLHLFDIDGVLYGDVEDLDRPTGDEDTFTVGQAAAVVTEFGYEYDFGDGWEHDIRVEQLMPSVGAATPQLLAGARACPPEDCGGAPGYEELLAAITDAHHEEHEHLVEWLGGSFDPEAFDLAGTNAHLALYDRHTRQRRGRS